MLIIKYNQTKVLIKKRTSRIKAVPTTAFLRYVLQLLHISKSPVLAGGHQLGISIPLLSIIISIIP